MRSSRPGPGLLPMRWAVILMAAAVAAILVGGLTFAESGSGPAALLAALAASGMTALGLHQVLAT